MKDIIIKPNETVNVPLGRNYLTQLKSGSVRLSCLNHDSGVVMVKNEIVELHEGSGYQFTNFGYDFAQVALVHNSSTVIPQPTEEIIIFSNESVPNNITYIDNGGTLYYSTGDLLSVSNSNTYPLQRIYTSDDIGRATSQPSFTQLSNIHVTQSNMSAYRLGPGIITPYSTGPISVYNAVETEENMQYMGVFSYSANEWVAYPSDDVTLTEETPVWDRMSCTFDISMPGEYHVYWATNLEGTKYYYETFSLGAGTYTMSKYINTMFGNNKNGITQLTKSSSVLPAYIARGTYGGSRIYVEPFYDDWDTVLVQFTNGASYQNPYAGTGKVNIPYEAFLLQSVKFYKE